MAPLVIRGVIQGGPWLYRTLFVGSAATAGATAGTALNTVRHNAQQESPSTTVPQSQVCSTCRDPRCDELQREMNHVVERRKGVDGEQQRGLRERANDMIHPRRDLNVQEVAGGGRGRRPGGHHIAWSETQNQLIRRLNEWRQRNCGPYPEHMEEWATMPPPRPGSVIPP